MTASFTPNSSQWGTVLGPRLPGFAASDIVQGAAVCLASNNSVLGGFQFQMCASSSQKPVGIARDYAIAGNPVSIFVDGNIPRINVGGNGAGGSVGQYDYIGLVGTSTMVHPQSGVTVTFGALGKVSGTASQAVGLGAAAVWAVGVAYEAAFPGDFSAFRIEPRTLSGGVNN